MRSARLRVRLKGTSTHFGRNVPVEKTPFSRSMSKPFVESQMSVMTEGVAVAVKQRTRSAAISLAKRDTLRYSARKDGPARYRAIVSGLCGGRRCPRN